MRLSDILDPTTCAIDVAANSKKRVLELISELLAQRITRLNNVAVSEALDLDTHAILNELAARERLGSTGIGFGVALPHCRLSGLKQCLGGLIRLRNSVDFGAPDGQKIDLVLAILVPESETDTHLQLLSTIAERFNQETFRQNLRDAKNNDDFFHVVTRNDDRG